MGKVGRTVSSYVIPSSTHQRVLIHRQVFAVTMGSLNQFVAALHWVHCKADCQDPTQHRVVRQLLTAARRLCARPINRRSPLRSVVFNKVVATLAIPTAPLQDWQTAALFVLGLTALLRWDDLQHLTPQDISICGTHMSLHLRQRKNDQLRQGDVVMVSRLEQQATTPCPVSVIEGFLERARHVPTQPLFGKVSAATHQPCLRGKMTYARARELIHTALARVGEDPTGYSTHSLRSGGGGGATAVANAGVPERLLQRQGGWKSSTCKNMYV